MARGVLRSVPPEVVLVLGCLAAAATLSLPTPLGLWVGLGLTAVSFAAGAIAGVGYHVALHRALAPLPRGWWWNPVALHERLGADQRPRVMAWFLVGVVGFVGSLLGCAVFLSAALRT